MLIFYMMETEYVSSTQAQKVYKVAEQTLRDWANTGKVEFIRTANGHRRYKIEVVKEVRKKIIYARVSSKKQENDLANQVKYLQKKYPDYEVVKDIGSGINYKRKGFRRILEQLFKGDIEEVVVTTADRFSRFGSDLFDWIFEQFRAKLTILNSRKFKSNSEELSEDLMAIITVFTSRYYGRRKNSNKEDTVLSEPRAEAAT